MSEALPRVGSAVIVRDEANRILLGKRNKDPQRGNWILPGGKIKAFESIAEAAARELQEETGLEVEVQNQFRVYEVIKPPDEHRIIIYSWARVRGGSLTASDDISEVKFFSLDELGVLPVTPLVRHVLQDAGYFGREQRSEQSVSPHKLLLFAIPIGGAVTHQGRRAPRKRARRPSYRYSATRQGSLSFDASLKE